MHIIAVFHFDTSFKVVEHLHLQRLSTIFAQKHLCMCECLNLKVGLRDPSQWGFVSFSTLEMLSTLESWIDFKLWQNMNLNKALFYHKNSDRVEYLVINIL